MSLFDMSPPSRWKIQPPRPMDDPNWNPLEDFNIGGLDPRRAGLLNYLRLFDLWGRR